MENSSNYLREHQIVKFNREASNATKNTKLARVKPARDRDRVGCFIPHPIWDAVDVNLVCCRVGFPHPTHVFLVFVECRIDWTFVMTGTVCQIVKIFV